MVTIDIEGRIVEFNSAAEQLFGWPRAAVIGRELASVLVPERLRERHRRGLAKYRATGQGAILGRRIEMPALRSDGREFPAELTVMPVGFDDPSAPALFSATLRDVTAQKQAAYIDARLAAIVASADDAILSTELDGTILSWNAGAERTYGYSADEVIGLTVDRLAPAHLSGEFVSLVQRVMRGESVHQYETERLRKDGRQIVIALTVSLVRLPNGDVAGVSAIGRDITSQKHAEDERRRLERQILEARHWESLGVLAGGIAHDFNNLLVGILGNAELVATQLPPGSPLRETLEQIEASANRAAELTRHMLAYAGKGR